MSYFVVLLVLAPRLVFFFFFNDTATTEIYTLSLHDALPILLQCRPESHQREDQSPAHERRSHRLAVLVGHHRSEEHTSELQSLTNLVCRLLLEKKKLPIPISTRPKRGN